MLLHQGKIEGCSLSTFEAVTGLSRTTDEGGLRDELPPITTWLNRLLALRIETQNLVFEVFEQLMTAKSEGAIAAGNYDKGLETITAESIVVTDRRTVYTPRLGRAVAWRLNLCGNVVGHRDLQVWAKG